MNKFTCESSTSKLLTIDCSQDVLTHLRPGKGNCFSRKLPPRQILLNFYRRTIESITAGNITNWQGMCPAQDRGALQQVIKTTPNIIGAQSPSISDIGQVSCLCRVRKILKTIPSPPCCRLPTDTEVSAAVSADYRAASLLMLWDAFHHPRHSTRNDNFCMTFIHQFI